MGFCSESNPSTLRLLFNAFKNTFISRMRYFILLVGLLFSASSFAQNLTLSGYIKDANTGEALIGAAVAVLGTPARGTVTNVYGYYVLSLPAGTYDFQVSYLGYTTHKQALSIKTSQKLNIDLQPAQQMLKEVVVTGEADDQRLRQSQMGVEKMDIATVNKLPILFGERDVLKSMQLLPGVKAGGEGQSGFSVRGGNLDQNLILLDDAPVYNASHLLGFFSTFNSDAIKDLTLHKGTAPANFGGRLASVVDVRMKEGNNQKYNVSGGLGLIASRLNVEGPIQEGRSSFLLSGRRTYADVFLRLNDEFANNSLYFYDFNAKLNYRLTDKDHIYLSGYFGRDVFSFDDQFGINWGNATGTLRYTRLISDKLFLNSSLIYSNYDYNIGFSTSALDININSGIEDWNIKQELQYFASNNQQWKVGYNVIYHTVTPGLVNAENTDISNLQKRGLESAAYLSHDWKPTERFSITSGLRFSHFAALGGSDYYTLDANRTVIDTFNPAGVAAQYAFLEPRLAVNYNLTATSSLKTAYTRNTQHIHLVSNAIASTPTDRWLMTTNNVAPEIGDQFSIGYFRNFKENTYEFSVETYYKWMQNQLDYKDGANDQATVIDPELLFGDGRAYGLEWLFRKNKGRFTGWLSYTLSRSERRIEGINQGQWYAARQDRTHDIAVVALYEISERFNVSAAWVYQTGNAVTFPAGKYNIADQVVWLYTERNGYRMPAYHRLDLGATYQLKPKRKYSSELAFSLYNAYGRQNPFLINFEQSATNPNRTVAVQTALFRWVPAVSWNFKF